jgi:hypothetical protein
VIVGAHKDTNASIAQPFIIIIIIIMVENSGV